MTGLQVNVRKSSLVGLMLFFSVMTSHVFAGEMKIGFIDTGQVLETSPQAAAAQKRLEKEFSPRDKELVATQKKIVKLEEKLTRDGAIMSDTERRRLERDILTQKRDLKRAGEEAREDFNIRRNEEFDKVRRQVRKVIADIAAVQKFDLILEGGVVFSSERVNITKEVVKQLELENKSSKKSNK